MSKLENREIDILVGTQMVTKGLDFDNVRLVGVLSADALLCIITIFEAERAYQMLMQVSGRAGRKNQRGQVIIQMSDVKHPIVDYLMDKNGYQKLFTKETCWSEKPIVIRLIFGYLRLSLSTRII
ncbi:MAG: helicase-related protein [Chitinophagales bacterium]